MSMFASRQSVRIEIEKTPGGKEQWVDLRRELTVGTRDYMYGRLYKRKAPDTDEIELDVESALSLAQTIECWVVDWQLYDEDEQPVELSPAGIAGLSIEGSELIMQRIGELRAERDARKKGGSPAPAS